MITGFVSIMMVVIEYLNILSQGGWQRGLRGGRWRQYLLASFLGAFTVVSLYLHREISLGALVVAMVATSGDESFVMLSMIPEQAPFIFILLFFIGLVAGFVTDALVSKKTDGGAVCHEEFTLHEEEICRCFAWGSHKEQWLQCSVCRGILGGTLLAFLFAIVSGQLGPAAWNWIRVTLAILSVVALFIVLTVPDHFLEEHLWNHVVRQHVPKVFLWTFGALLLMHILMDHLYLEGWMKENQLIVLLVACLVGIIPESGRISCFLPFLLKVPFLSVFSWPVPLSRMVTACCRYLLNHKKIFYK